jgi:hypothetical protein
MADLVITAANVAAGTGARTTTGTAGATITAGQVVYQDPADNKYKPSDCNGASAAIRSVAGIALNGASAGQPLTILLSGPLTPGATLTPGVAYYLSANPGGICPVADLIAGCYPTILGIATSATALDVLVHPAGVSL